MFNSDSSTATAPQTVTAEFGVFAGQGQNSDSSTATLYNPPHAHMRLRAVASYTGFAVLLSLPAEKDPLTCWFRQYSKSAPAVLLLSLLRTVATVVT